jgi:hypothetical protein
MSFSIIPTEGFGRELKRLSKKYLSLKKEYAELLDSLEKNPRMGAAIGKNCYKIRLSIESKGKGKSGGARVITHLIVKVDVEALYLLKIYDKSEQENISTRELNELLTEIS